jgi:DinB superfamily
MNQVSIFAKATLNAWSIQIDRTNKFLNSLSDVQLMQEIAPGKNRGIYLVGHLIAVHDAMPEILGLGQKNHPEYQLIFLQTPDKQIADIPTIAELRQNWISVHERLQKAFEKMPAEDWFKRHESMTDEDFAKDPARNKLSVLLNRTNHLAYHFGQLRLLK